MVTRFREGPIMALLPCTCIFGAAPSDAVGPVDPPLEAQVANRLIALVRDPFCPALSLHESRLVARAERPTALAVSGLGNPRRGPAR